MDREDRPGSEPGPGTGGVGSDGRGGAPTRRRSGGRRWVTVVCVVVVLVLVDLAVGAVLTWTGMIWPADRGDVYLLEHE